VLKDGFLVREAQQLEEIFGFLMYETSFIKLIVGFGVKSYTIQNNKIGQNFGIFNLLLSDNKAKNPKSYFR
jgi:hypothetical protein